MQSFAATESSGERLKPIRWALSIFMVGLALSGLTAFPIQWGIELIVTTGLGIPPTATPENYGILLAWLIEVRQGIGVMYSQFPWIAYGTDWLAFAHLILAVLFIGPWRDPMRNIWVIEFGIFSCLAVIPLALICGGLREVPFFWRLVDCSFGVFGVIPLLFAHRWTLELEVQA